MAEDQSYVIIGNGIAGVTAAEVLRTENAAASIVVIADDPLPIYYRPALKDYLAGKIGPEKLWARPQTYYQQHGIRLLTDQVIGIQVQPHTLFLQSGTMLTYSRLLLASGARARSLTCPGMNLIGVTSLRSVADYQKVLAYLSQVRRVVVVGSGTLALETCETLRQRGYAVTHLVRGRRFWAEVLDTTASDLVLQQKVRDGGDVRFEHPSISRRHAEISYANGQYVLRDLASSNGTFLNDQPVEPGSLHRLSANDTLRFGQVLCVFRLRQVDPASSMLLRAHKPHILRQGHSIAAPEKNKG